MIGKCSFEFSVYLVSFIDCFGSDIFKYPRYHFFLVSFFSTVKLSLWNITTKSLNLAIRTCSLLVLVVCLSLLLCSKCDCTTYPLIIISPFGILLDNRQLLKPLLVDCFLNVNFDCSVPQNLCPIIKFETFDFYFIL